MADQPDLEALLAERLIAIPGVVAVALGGSRARGTARPDSDLDLGLYYDGARPLDIARLNALCRELDDAGAAQATPTGGWGPWVDGGAWLTVRGQRVDFIYRDVRRVEVSVDDALAGRVALHAQVGHPHGIHGHHYAAELALAVVLLDPSGALARLRARLGPYPRALGVALEQQYAWQADFWLAGAAKARARGDVHWLQGCAYQAVMAMVQTLCARRGVWLTNEKGAVRVAGNVPGAPRDFEARVQAALSALDFDALLELSAEVNR